MMAEAKVKKGFFENKFKSSFWDSKISSANVKGKERWLGYVLGPFGIMMVQSIVNSYFNQYLTDVMGFTVNKGAWIAIFMVMFPLMSKILDAFTNIAMAKMIDKTACKQGKLRPWFIVSLPIIALSVIMLFWIPFADPIVQAIWIVIAYNLFYAVGYTMWYMSYELSAALSTRNIKQRSGNSMAGQITKNMGTGTISILFPTVLVGVCKLLNVNNQKGYLITMALICCIAIPLTFIQYFFTRERITEERRNQYGTVNIKEKNSVINEASFWVQLKACMKDKYWIMLIVMILIYQVLNALKNISLVYYSGWVVNGNAYGEFASIQAKFQMIAMSPMGIGILVLLPLIRKYGRRKAIIMGSIATIIGSGIAFFMAGNMGAIFAGSAISSLGAMAYIYTLTTFIGDAIDHVEYSQGIRAEGFVAALVGFAHCLSNGLGQAIFNFGLIVTKYTTPEKIGIAANGVDLYADQPKAATTWINMSYQGSYLFMGILFLILFLFYFNIEKVMPTVHDALQLKKKEECAAKGIEYIPAQELERLEIEKQKAEAEKIRIKELELYCKKTNKNFDIENQKYLKKKEKKAKRKRLFLHK